MELDKEFRVVNKEMVDIARSKLPTILNHVRVVGQAQSTGNSTLATIGGAQAAQMMSDQYRTQQNNAARVVADTNVNQFMGVQAALQNGGGRAIQPGCAKQTQIQRPSRRAEDLPLVTERPIDKKTGKPLSNRKMKSKMSMSGAQGVKHS